MRNDMVLFAASQIVASQVTAGVVHPSPGKIAEAVDVAEAIVDEIERRESARDAAEHPAPAAQTSAPSSPPPATGTAPTTPA